MDNSAQVEVEKSVIGTIIMSGEATIDVCVQSGVTPLWFSNSKCRTCFEILLTMSKIEMRLFMLEAEKGKLTDYVGGAEFVIECCDAATSVHFLQSHIEELESAYKLSRIGFLAGEMAASVRASKEPDIIIAEVSNALVELTGATVGVTAAEAMSDNITVLKNSAKGITSGLPLPWPKITALTGGAQLASMIPLVGRDGKGKSGALAQILDFWAGEKIPTLCFSLEDVKRRVLLRMGGNRMRYSARMIETGYTYFHGRQCLLSPAEVQSLERKITDYMAFLESAPFWIYDEPHNVEQICSRIRHYKRTKGIRAATIDGFKDIVFTKGKTTNEAQNHISQSLASVAKECNIALFVVSHIRKTADDVAICKQDITGASSQFQGARQVFIFQDSGVDGVDGEQTFAIDCTKSNFTGGGMVLLERDPSILTYRET